MFSQASKARAFASYRPTRHDVFVATFGKSGTNWMMQISQQIAYRGEAEFDHIHDLVAWPDTPAPGPVALTDPSPAAESPTGLRIIKTHLETDFVPYDEQAIYLTVLRDPKEVLVSSYYFLGGIFGVLSHVTIDDWFELFSRPGSLATRWAIHTAGFWAWRDRPNVLVTTYPELKSLPRACIERVAATMGVELSGSELAKVIERSSFDHMKAHESQFAPPERPFASAGSRTVMVRRGESGGSGEVLSPAQQATLDSVCQEELARLGSDFPYATAFEVVADPKS
jgi:hypothetical protein